MRRTVRSLIIALVLGAATTVAAAWLVGNLPRLRPELPVVTATRGDGLRQVTVTPYSYGRFYFIVSHRIVDYVGQHREMVAELEQRRAEGAWVTMPRALDDRAWGETPGLVRSVAARHEKIYGVAQGWPWPSMYALCGETTFWDIEEYRGMFSIARPAGDFLFPWYIHPPGFARSTSLYAAPWLVVVAMPGMVRRWRRRRGGRCEGCGYDLSGLAAGACPECGAVMRRGRRAREGAGAV